MRTFLSSPDEAKRNPGKPDRVRPCTDFAAAPATTPFFVTRQRMGKENAPRRAALRVPEESSVALGHAPTGLPWPDGAGFSSLKIRPVRPMPPRQRRGIFVFQSRLAPASSVRFSPSARRGASGRRTCAVSTGTCCRRTAERQTAQRSGQAPVGRPFFRPFLWTSKERGSPERAKFFFPNLQSNACPHALRP